MSHTGPLSIMFMSSQCLPNLRHPYYVQVVCLCGAWWVSKLQLTEDVYITLQKIQLHILQQSAKLVLARIFCVLHPCLSISRTIFLLWACEGLSGDLTPPRDITGTNLQSLNGISKVPAEPNGCQKTQIYRSRVSFWRRNILLQSRQILHFNAWGTGYIWVIKKKSRHVQQY